MKILRINDWTGPPGGAEVYIASVSRALHEAGHPQRTLSITDAPEVSEYRPQPWEEVLPLRRMSARRLVQDLRQDPVVIRHLERMTREFQPDLIHLHHFDSLFSPMARFLRDVDIPLVMTAHDAKLVCPIGTLVLPGGRLCEGRILPRCQLTGCEVGFGLPYKLRQDQLFRRDVAPKVRLFLAPSRAAAATLERNDLAPTRVLAPFVEVPDEVARAPAPWPAGPPTLGYLGRLEPYKGVSTLLEAVARARKKLPQLQLRIAGRGPQEPALKEQARSLGLTKDRSTRFLGWVTGAEKEDFFRQIQLLAVPSEGYENFGLIGLEALARGRGALGSDLGGIPDWLKDGEVGRLVPPHNVPAWTQAIVEAFGDPVLLQAWGQAARARYERCFQPSVHLRGLVSAYEEVLRAPPAGGRSLGRGKA